MVYLIRQIMAYQTCFHLLSNLLAKLSPTQVAYREAISSSIQPGLFYPYAAVSYFRSIWQKP